jgi:hypothetical protein
MAEHDHEAPDRQKAGSTNWRSQFDRPQADPKGEARSAE